MNFSGMKKNIIVHTLKALYIVKGRREYQTLNILLFRRKKYRNRTNIDALNRDINYSLHKRKKYIFYTK